MMPPEPTNPTQRLWLKQMLHSLCTGSAPPTAMFEVFEFLLNDYPVLGDESNIGVAILSVSEFRAVKSVLAAMEDMYEHNEDFGEALWMENYAEKQGWGRVMASACDAHRILNENDKQRTLSAAADSDEQGTEKEAD